MFLHPHQSYFRFAFIAVLCLLASVSRAEQVAQSGPSTSLAPILRSWIESITQATWQSGRWLVESSILQLGVSTQNDEPMSRVFFLNGLGSNESITALASLPLTHRFVLGASAGFHHPQTAVSGAAEGFGSLGNSGRVFGVGVLAHLSENAEASLRLERLTAYAGSPQGTVDATVIAVGIGIRF